ncbi:MAG TPA: molybdenum cofactor guanylyltransferase [Thermomicrobiales bacterium]|nr:molybdenum cofactor guanylyltransferase [Thermomicrobiales bacterium]
MLPVSAAILTGGKSRRMGEPKALLRLEPAGPTLIERVVGTLRAVAEDVFLVGRPDWPPPDALAAMRMVEDDRQGAADGLIAALAGARHELCIVTACDMPFLDAGFLAEMIAIARDRGRSVLARDDTGRHPLHAVYRRVDLPQIRQDVSAGDRSLIRLCEAIEAIPMDTGRDRARGWSVFNINTPDDLAEARRYDRLLKEHPVHD